MVRSVNRAVSWHVPNLQTVHRILVAAARLVPVIIPSMPVVQSKQTVHRQTAQNRSHLYRAKQTIMHLVRHVRHVQRHIHILMQGQRLIHIVMRLRQALVLNWHAAPHRAVHRQRVGHAHRERAIGVTISLQPIHRVHQRIALNQLHL